ncbi:PorT family protein [Pedobacter sp. BS3]|uniref:type IX secretion/gliding motility protein PorT/SprT n=1 Tax=Pedobacter sp. BS3 TaxID=2567937 RepID=UPI0011EEA74C|nr:outer membrane beta-barrel protein [Pedobacter sp. BS3]TZF84884.1 PorT family protein [Pedobacter sp. BS3]
MTKRLIAVYALLLSGFAANAQNWAGGVDDEALHFGFMFQYISSEYKILKKTDWRNPYPNPDIPGKYITDSLNSIYSKSATGFGLGFVVNFRLGENADIRFTPGLSFADRMLYYEYPNSGGPHTDPGVPEPNTYVSLEENPLTKKVPSTMVDFPLGLKIKSNRLMNFRAYFLTGIKYSTDIVSKKKLDDSGNDWLEKYVKNQRHILSYEVGVGFDLYFEFFKMTPELKFSQSINSVLKPEDQPFSKPLDKLFLRNIQFSLFFE